MLFEEPCVFYNEEARSDNCTLRDLGSVRESIPQIVRMAHRLKHPDQGLDDSVLEAVVSEVEGLFSKGLDNELQEGFEPGKCYGLSEDFHCSKYGFSFNESYSEAVRIMMFLGKSKGCLCYFLSLISGEGLSV